jgi:two-component system sensor kinase FixL
MLYHLVGLLDRALNSQVTGAKPLQVQDIERRLQELQEELIHVARISAMGTMASALAHELNQPLTAVANFVMAAQALLAIDQPEAQAEARGALADATTEAVRAGQIVRRLRDFVARGETERQIVSLTRLIEEATALALVGAIQHGVRVEMNLDPAVSQVLVDRVQIQQVLLNLIRNAIEAMVGGELRELVISTTALSDEEVELSVADTGPGLADQIAEHLFEPFFSTKAEGLGVGLAICRTIIEAHGGRLWAEACPQGGMIFRFTVTRLDVSERSE